MSDNVTGRGQGSVVEPSIAVGWIVAASVTAALVLLLLGSAVSGSRLLAWVGLMAVTQLVWFAQAQFIETHRRRNHRWSGTLGMFWTGSPSRHEQAEAWRHRDPVRSIELCRLFGIGLLGFALVSGIALFGAVTGIR
ncbi:MAG: hypothetical protein ACYC65_04445 [Candidatus Limnocylindrales bacterium]